MYRDDKFLPQLSPDKRSRTCPTGWETERFIAERIDFLYTDSELLYLEVSFLLNSATGIRQNRQQRYQSLDAAKKMLAVMVDSAKLFGWLSYSDSVKLERRLSNSAEILRKIKADLVR